MTLPPEEPIGVSASATFRDAFVEHHSAIGFKRQTEAAAGFDAYERLPKIKAPTLVLCGTCDQLVPTDNSRILASGIPNAELVVFEGAGHGYLCEGGDQANQVVRDFLKRHPIELKRW